VDDLTFAEVTALKGFVEQRGEIIARGGEAGVSHTVVGFLTVMARDQRAPREVVEKQDQVVGIRGR
jgi:hypothetical protein